ncbi:MAG: N-acyl-D-glucosamine 2-epimerase [Bacteroidetes bacterium]|nr:MAG: N-acyl-D-glucosamine 2-epimerase [Bacteroidota bacterium]
MAGNIPSEIKTDLLKKEFRVELANIMDWWAANMIDEQHGGFFGQRNAKGELVERVDKGIILNSRLLWTYSAAAIATGDSIYKRLADRAFRYVKDYFWDEVQGGVFWSVDYMGNYADDQKQIYAQAFTIYALSEYFILTQKKEVLDMASEIFWLVEKYSHDTEKRGYYNAFARDWTDVDDIRLSEKDANEAKIMNTHLHVLEAYTNFYRVEPSLYVKKALLEVLQLFLDYFYNPENGSLHIYFDENWNPKGDHISFGHNIEASWLLWEAAEILKETSILKRVKEICLFMAENVYQMAIDKDGGLLYEADPSGIIDSDKHWWPQAEAVIGFWNAYQLTGQEKYAKASVNTWSFIKNSIIDPIYGEWHWRTDRDGNPILTEDKAGPWKAPYHNIRMCLEMMMRLT